MAQVGRMVKELSVAEMSAQLSDRPNFFVTMVQRLPATEADALRHKLATSQARLVLIKRRLGQRAVEPLQLSGLADLLQGSVGFVLAGGDVLHTARVLVEFRKSHEDQLSLRGAIIDGQLLDAARVDELAQLAPRPVLLAQVVATIESPLADVLFTIERLMGDLAWIAEQAATTQPLPADQPAGQAGTPTPSSESSTAQSPTLPAPTTKSQQPQEGTSS